MEFLNQTAFSIGESQVLWISIVYFFVVLILGVILIRWSTRLISSRLGKANHDASLVQMLSRAWFLLTSALLLLILLELLNVPLTAFAFVSGAIAIGVGFGAQNIINNFISGWILMWERPIRIGDFLEVGDMQGTVESVNTRYTSIRRVDGVHILVPNSHLLENQVVNWTLVDRVTRTSVRVGVAYGSDVDLVDSILNAVAVDNPDVLTNPPHAVFFEDFGDNALVFELVVWVEVTQERGLRMVRSKLRFALARAFAENDVVVAFPQRDVHLDGELRVLNEVPESDD